MFSFSKKQKIPLLLFIPASLTVLFLLPIFFLLLKSILAVDNINAEREKNYEKIYSGSNNAADPLITWVEK